MKPKWRYRDIIDLEYFIHQDKTRTSPEDLLRIRERDRRIYRDALPQTRDDNRSFLLHKWLSNRRDEETGSGNTALPGQLIEEVYVRVCLLFACAGIIIGAGAGQSFFTYTGTSPLNVFHYLTVFVFSQLVILLILLLSLLLRRKDRLPPPSLLSTVIAGIVTRLFQTACRHISSEISAKKRSDFQAIIGIIKAKRTSPLFFWPLLLLTQLFALGFNLGMLAVTLFKVAATDIAFGWQSTIQFSPEAVSHFVQVLALPWSWFTGGGIAYPSPAEIAGSRIVLKEGISHLATPDLVSWWPFLCLALFTYGLLPRLFLLLLALYKKRRSLSGLQFDQIAFTRLLARMRTPVVSTQAGPNQDRGASPAVLLRQAATDKRTHTDIAVMIPDDIFERCSDIQLQQVLAQTGDTLVKTMRIGETYQADRKLLEELGASENPLVPLLILTEAWMPPITDFIVFVQNLRKILPDNLPIRIGLIGRPEKESIFTPVDPADSRIWQQAIIGLGDPYTVAEDLIPNIS